MTSFADFLSSRPSVLAAYWALRAKRRGERLTAKCCAAGMNYPLSPLQGVCAHVTVYLICVYARAACVCACIVQ